MSYFVKSCVSMSLLLGVGCASYSPQPLTLERHVEAWQNQDIGILPIHTFADQLAAKDEADISAFDPTNGLTLCEAQAVALHFNPSLRLLRIQAKVPLVSAQEAGWWPDPEFEVEVMRYASRGTKGGVKTQGPSFDGVNTSLLGPGGFNTNGLEATPPGIRRTSGDFIEDPWILGASISFTIPLSGRLAIEKDLAWAEYDSAWQQIIIAEWELLRKLNTLWSEWETAQSRVSIINDYLEQFEAINEIVVQLVTAGELKPTEARIFAIEIARLRNALQSHQATVTQKRLAILATLGIAPNAPISLIAENYQPNVPDNEKDWIVGVLENHPHVQFVKAEYAVTEEQLRLEVAKQYPDLNVGPSWSLEDGLSRLGLGFGMPIPLWNRNRQAIAESEASRESARMNAEVTVETIFGQIAHAKAVLKAAQTHQETLLNDVGPLVDRQIEEVKHLLDVGEVDVLVLRDALNTSLETKLEILDATLNEMTAANELESMINPQWGTPARKEKE